MAPCYRHGWNAEEEERCSRCPRHMRPLVFRRAVSECGKERLCWTTAILMPRMLLGDGS
jgi:hypothetical protein